jgi:hypothetical protein
MQTVKAPHREETVQRVRRRQRWLIALVGLLVLALIGLGIWLVLDASVLDSRSDAEALVADYNEAWQDLDPDRVASFFAAGGAIRNVTDGSVIEGPEAIAQYVEDYPTGVRWLPGATADVTRATAEFGDIIESDGKYLASAYRWAASEGRTLVGISVIELWGDGDQILNHYMFFEIISE